MHSEVALEQINDLLAALGRRMALERLRLDSLGRCQLVVDHRWHVTLLASPVPGRLLLSCAVGAAGLAPCLAAARAGKRLLLHGLARGDAALH